MTRIEGRMKRIRTDFYCQILFILPSIRVIRVPLILQNKFVQNICFN